MNEPIPHRPRIDPRLRALYLVTIAVGVFFLPWIQVVAAVATAQLLLWIAFGLGFKALAMQMRRLVVFCAVILIAYSLVSEDPAVDRWRDIGLPWGYHLEVNMHGVIVGLTMVLRIIAVVLASHVARAGDAKALAAGLRGIGMPKMAALSLDATLSLLGGGARNKRSGGGGGKGDGSGGGKDARGFVAGIKRLARGDVGVLAEALLGHVDRVEAHVGASDDGQSKKEFIRDVAVVSGIALTMLGIKALKLVPGLPFAPGHKGVILIPLYIVAGFMTKSRAGATMTGLTFGTAAFLLGDGRWGLFEIAKHVSPGILVDLLLPFLRIARARNSKVAWGLFGMIIALGRFATITVIALSVQAPALVYAFLLPGLAIHAVFGIISGLVTGPLLRALDLRQQNPARVASQDDSGGNGGGGGDGRGGGRRGGGGRGGGSGGGGSGGGGSGGQSDGNPSAKEKSNEQAN